MVMLINKHHVIIYEVQNMEETYLKHNKINVIIFWKHLKTMIEFMT
jgi:hypothetical protein